MGIYTTLACFQTFRPQKRGFLETGFRLCLVTMSRVNGHAKKLCQNLIRIKQQLQAKFKDQCVTKR